MVKYYGKTVFKGVAIGPAVVLKNEEQQVKRRKVGNPEDEVKRVGEGLETAQAQLQALYEKAVVEVGEAWTPSIT